MIRFLYSQEISCKIQHSWITKIDILICICEFHRTYFKHLNCRPNATVQHFSSEMLVDYQVEAIKSSSLSYSLPIHYEQLLTVSLMKSLQTQMWKVETAESSNWVESNVVSFFQKYSFLFFGHFVPSSGSWQWRDDWRWFATKVSSWSQTNVIVTISYLPISKSRSYQRDDK